MIIMAVLSKREDVMEPEPIVSADGIPEEDNVEHATVVNTRPSTCRARIVME